MTKAYAFAGTTMTVLVSGAETGGAYSVLHVIKPSGSSTPPHSHDRGVELSYVLEGTLSVETEGRTETREAGKTLVLPAGRPHRLFNASGATIREVLVCAPALFDGFVATAGTPVEPYAEPQPMSAEERQRLVETAPRFGVTLLRSAEPDGPAAAPGPQTPKSFDLPESRFEMLARVGTIDEDLVLVRALVEPGHDMPLDGHIGQATVYLIDGALDVRRGTADWTRLLPAEALHIASGATFVVRNAEDTAARCLVVSTARAARQSFGAAQP